jgi:hypothetical protein
LAAEQHEEAVLLATEPPGGGLLAVDLSPLFGLGIFVLADLLGPRGVGAAAVECLELRFKAGAHRVLLGLLLDLRLLLDLSRLLRRRRQLLLRARIAEQGEQRCGRDENPERNHCHTIQFPVEPPRVDGLQP